MSIQSSSFKSSRARAIKLFSDFCANNNYTPDDAVFPKLLDLVLTVHENAYFDANEGDNEMPF